MAAAEILPHFYYPCLVAVSGKSVYTYYIERYFAVLGFPQKEWSMPTQTTVPIGISAQPFPFAYRSSQIVLTARGASIGRGTAQPRRAKGRPHV